MLQMFRQVPDVNEVAGRGDTGGGNHIFQFTHISGPRGYLCEKEATRPIVDQTGLGLGISRGICARLGVAGCLEEKLYG
jgi:hypothetical protein